MEAKNEIKVVKEDRDVMSEIAPTNYAVSKSYDWRAAKSDWQDLSSIQCKSSVAVRNTSLFYSFTFILL